ncbi:MAG: thioredoxin domain-containing protein [Myxococcales bacterium]|nr:thioredoxin domain-containing protein [Myxococcota bacterium]MDW8280228.1 thioredoxin domain-containing protein [Myxococcales bacterium]
MATTAATTANFDQLTDRDGIVLIDWWAPWCGPCRAFAPVYESASDRHTDVTFLKVNTDEQQELAEAFMIQAVPTLMVFRDRVLVFAQPGAVSGAALDELIRQVRALDMDEVRREIERAEEQLRSQEAEQD